MKSKDYNKKFLKDAEVKTFDAGHRETIKFNIGRYNNSVEKGLAQFSDYETARDKAAAYKESAINNLYRLLLSFEHNFTRNGGKVIWAQNKEEAQYEILNILRQKQTRSVVKSKTMISEEIHLNEFLEHNGIEAVETDLGEYIVQLAEQKPYHIVTPAMHMSRKDIGELFSKKLKIPFTDDARDLTLTARKLLRQKYADAEVGITGANFLIADTGSIAITENEGNARLTTTLPKTHIAIAGIEKMLASIDQLELMWPMLATSGTGQNVTVYNSILSGPRKAGEADGPDEMYVVLLDNGRTKLLADKEKREALHCIRCGACLNTCPVYKNVGGHTYNTTYSGPIGSVITPHYEGMEKFKHLSYSSSLCGSCTAVCPVRINIHNLLLLNRKQSVEQQMVSKTEKLGFRLWRKAMLNRSLMNMGGSGVKNLILKIFLRKSWGKRRTLPKLASKSFNQQYRERMKNKKDI
ncbi:LutB/LldF family L-lactate oxidation iron-sulfur protein [Cytophagaceae bacterium ABcell3]|nr:LutB/LldF family L-lactate oxidation iron-sulfur protein [Cytophagaceae bacterium ABcell3]